MITAVAAVGALGLAIVVSHESPPKPEPPPAALVSVFEPKKVTVVATRWKPWLADWSVEETVRLRTNDENAVYPKLERASSRLAGVGQQVDARVTRSISRQDGLDVRIRIGAIPTAGEYAGALTVDPLAEKSAALEITLKARDAFYLPLLVLFAGMALGVLGMALYEARRRRDILRMALVDAGLWLQFVPRPPGLYDLQGELVGHDVNTDLFPPCRWRQPQPTLGVPLLYSRICGTFTKDGLDARTKELEKLLSRIDLWYRAGVALQRLRAALAGAPADVPSTLRSESEGLIALLADEPTAEGETLVTQTGSQARVVDAFVSTWAAWIAANSPANLNPASVYSAFPAAGERTEEDSRKLIARLLERKAAIRPQFDLVGYTRVVCAEGAPAWSLATGAETAPAAEAQVLEPPWARSDDGGVELVRRIRRGVRFGDLFAFIAHSILAAVAFLLPVWTATNFGSWSDYLAVFAAGFLGKVALDRAIAPVRSVRFSPSSQGTPAPAPQPAGGTPGESPDAPAG